MESFHRLAHVLQAVVVVQQRGALAGLDLSLADEFVSEFQHHDAITGTHDPDVEDLYADHLLQAQQLLREATSLSLGRLTSLNEVESLFLRCWLLFLHLNISNAEPAPSVL